jgi:HSP20 family protein
MEETMSEIKEAPKPKTQNGAGQTKDVAPRATASPMLSTASPLAFMRRFAAEMDRMFEDFGLQTRMHIPNFVSRGHELMRRQVEFNSAEWSPRVDVLEGEGQIVVRADLPGLSKEDIKVEVTDDMLTIQGERKHVNKEDRDGCCYSECSYGSFYRAIPLPEGAEAGKAKAEFNKGVLEITVPAPKRPEAKAKRLEVREVK